jgi:excisionase family DNA binding protein
MDHISLVKAHLEAATIFDANNTCLTVEECAKFLNVHPKTITNKIHAGTIKAIFIGRIWRIQKMQFVEQLLQKI